MDEPAAEVDDSFAVDEITGWSDSDSVKPTSIPSVIIQPTANSQPYNAHTRSAKPKKMKTKTVAPPELAGKRTGSVKRNPMASSFPSVQLADLNTASENQGPVVHSLSVPTLKSVTSSSSLGAVFEVVSVPSQKIVSQLQNSPRTYKYTTPKHLRHHKRVRCHVVTGSTEKKEDPMQHLPPLGYTQPNATVNVPTRHLNQSNDVDTRPLCEDWGSTTDQVVAPRSHERESSFRGRAFVSLKLSTQLCKNDRRADQARNTLAQSMVTPTERDSSANVKHFQCDPDQQSTALCAPRRDTLEDRFQMETAESYRVPRMTGRFQSPSIRRLR